MIVVAARPVVAVLVIVRLVVVLQITEAGNDVGALIRTPLAASTSRETEVVSERIGVKPLGVGIVVVPDVTVSVT